MKRMLLTLFAVTLLLTPGSALAKGKGKGPVYVPPNQSAASQYTEDVPTAGGETPTEDVHHIVSGVPSTGSHGGGSGGSGSAGSGHDAGSGGSISGSVLSAMSRSGSNGSAAAAIDQALAPHTPAASHARATSVAAVRRAAAVHAGSPTGQVLETLAGSDAGSGVGIVLPIILIGSLVFATVVGLGRFRWPGTTTP